MDCNPPVSPWSGFEMASPFRLQSPLSLNSPEQIAEQAQDVATPRLVAHGRRNELMRMEGVASPSDIGVALRSLLENPQFCGASEIEAIRAGDDKLARHVVERLLKNYALLQTDFDAYMKGWQALAHFIQDRQPPIQGLGGVQVLECGLHYLKYLYRSTNHLLEKGAKKNFIEHIKKGLFTPATSIEFGLLVKLARDQTLIMTVRGRGTRFAKDLRDLGLDKIVDAGLDAIFDRLDSPINQCLSHRDENFAAEAPKKRRYTSATTGNSSSSSLSTSSTSSTSSTDPEVRPRKRARSETQAARYGQAEIPGQPDTDRFDHAPADVADLEKRLREHDDFCSAERVNALKSGNAREVQKLVYRILDNKTYIALYLDAYVEQWKLLARFVDARLPKLDGFGGSDVFACGLEILAASLPEGKSRIVTNERAGFSKLVKDEIFRPGTSVAFLRFARIALFGTLDSQAEIVNRKIENCLRTFRMLERVIRLFAEDHPDENRSANLMDATESARLELTPGSNTNTVTDSITTGLTPEACAGETAEQEAMQSPEGWLPLLDDDAGLDLFGDFIL
jgi:hypothetical protein